jgi:hypothetical protein
MDLSDVTGLGVKDLGPRVNLVTTLPSLVVSAGVFLLIWSGAPSHHPDPDRAVHTLAGLSGAETALLVVVLISAVLLTHPLQLSAVRLLEGYGSPRSVLQPLRRKLLDRHVTRREGLAKTASDLEASPDDRQAAAIKLIYDYPSADAVMATKLGNILRAAENTPRTRYGIDAIVAWPRLMPFVSDELRAALCDQRNQLDVACRFCVMLALGALVSAGLLIRQGPWLALPLAPLALSFLAYQSAVVAARAYGESIKAAFDLHRFALLTQMHLPLPADIAAEKAFNTRLYGMLLQGAPVNLTYEHPEPPAAKTA